jgi:hypothetical protein
MKKLLIPLALVLFAFMGCNRTKSNPNDVDVKLYTLIDSVFIESEYGDDYAYYTLNADLPITKNDSLRKNILHWMLSDETEDYATYFENEKDYFFSEEGDEPRSYLESNYTLSEQTDFYVTYISEGFVYTGGAHPMPWYFGTSFSKIDGSIIGYDIFDDPEQLKGIISENVRKQYFEPNNTEEEEYLFEDEEPFQLPSNQPWIETDSVVFCYQAYEIAPYSAGAPLCKIAINDLKPYLSEKGKSLFNSKGQ